MKKFAFILFWLLSAVVPAAAGPIIINSNALVALPSSAQLRLFRGTQPDDGSVQLYNPPIFCTPYNEQWFKFPIETDGGLGTNIQPRVFEFQASTNISFVPLQCDLVTSNNLENLQQKPFTNADGTLFVGTMYFRWIYHPSNGVAGGALGTNGPHNFILTSDSVAWDRSMLSDSNYILGKTNPFFFTNFTTAEESFIRSFSDGPNRNWTGVTNEASNTVSQLFWTNAAIATNIMNPEGATNSHLLSDVALVALVTTNLTQLTNCGVMVSLMSTVYQQKGLTNTEDYNLQGDPKYFAMAYNYCRPYMSDADRSNSTVLAEQWGYKFALHHDLVYDDNNITHGLRVSNSSSQVQGADHPAAGEWGSLFMLSLAFYQDSAKMRELFPFAVNDLMFDGGDDLMLQSGPGYNEQIAFESQRNIGPLLLMNIRFPEAHLERCPWLTNANMHAAYDQPIGYGSPSEPSDFGYPRNRAGAYPQFFNDAHEAIARIAQDGASYQMYLRAVENHPQDTPEFDFLLNPWARFYYPAPSQVDYPSRTYVNLVEGQVRIGSVQPSDRGAFTNESQLRLYAFPAGNNSQHGNWADGSFQDNFAGANIFVDGIDDYSEGTLFCSGVFVDGIGVQNPINDPVEPYYSRITAFTNGPDFTVVGEDLTRDMNRSNFTAVGKFSGYGLDANFYAASTNKRPYVTLVTETWNANTNGYRLRQTHFKTTQPAIFAVKYHVPELATVVDTNNCAFTTVSTNWSLVPSFGKTNVLTANVTNMFTLPYPVILGGTYTAISTNVPNTNAPTITTSLGTQFNSNVVVSQFIWTNGSPTIVTNTNYWLTVNYKALAPSLDTDVIILGQAADIKTNSVVGLLPVTCVFKELDPTNLVAMTRIHGTNQALFTNPVLPSENYSNAVLGAGGSASSNPELVLHLPADVFWITNRVPTNDFTFTEAWAMGRWDQNPPAITVISPDTVKIVGDAYNHTNTFDPNYSGASTIKVSLDSSPTIQIIPAPFR